MSAREWSVQQTIKYRELRAELESLKRHHFSERYLEVWHEIEDMKNELGGTIPESEDL